MPKLYNENENLKYGIRDPNKVYLGIQQQKQ